MERFSEHGMVRAIVMHGAIETRYWRAGHGPPVVVLGLDLDGDGRMPGVLAPLVARCCVIVPEYVSISALDACHGEGRAPFSAWFRGFLEGLGIEGAVVVAAAGLDAALAQFVAANPGEIDRLIIVGAVADASAAPPALVHAGPPVWRADAPVNWGEVLRFLASEPPMAQSLAAG
jgi:hypothetical protein